MKQFEDDAPDVTETPLKKNKRLKALIEERQDAARIIAEAEERKKTASAELLAILSTAGVDRVRVGSFLTSIVTTERESLNQGMLKTELLESGMSLSVIERLWKKCSTTARASYVKVTERKEV